MRITGQMIFEKSLARLAARGADAARIRPAELWDLADAARACADPFREVNADAAGFPVAVGGVHLWRLTIGASVWLDEYAEPALGARSPAYKAALVYALAHARDKAAFEGLEDARTIRRAVAGFLRALAATPDEVNAALDRALGVSAAETGGEGVASAGADWATLCARLESQTGIPAAQWIWDRSSAMAISAYRQLHAFARAYAAGGRGDFETMRDELDRANERRMRAEAAILKRIEAERNNG